VFDRIEQVPRDGSRARPGDIITAASVVVTLPLIVLALLFQRRIISGLTAGAIR
jgi:ABC-type glycerol-3-phosphate transport system permease component